MFSSARLKACTSRTAEMLSCSSALTLPISLRDLAEGLARLVREIEGGEEHDRHDRQAEQGERHVGGQHVVGDPDQQQDAADHVDQGEADRLFDRVGVVGDAAHQVAGFVLGVIAQRQAVQVLEHFHPQRTQHVLAGPGHGEEGHAGQQRAEDEQDDQDQDQPHQAGDAAGRVHIAAVGFGAGESAQAEGLVDQQSGSSRPGCCPAPASSWSWKQLARCELPAKLPKALAAAGVR